MCLRASGRSKETMSGTLPSHFGACCACCASSTICIEEQCAKGGLLTCSARMFGMVWPDKEGGVSAALCIIVKHPGWV